MTDSQLTIIISVIPATIIALGTLISSIRTAKKADVIIEKAAEIHTLTNSAMSQMRLELAQAMEHIKGLEKLIAIQAETVKVINIPGPPGPPGPVGPMAV